MGGKNSVPVEKPDETDQPESDDHAMASHTLVS